MSNATYVTLNYLIHQAVTLPERVHLRFVLMDASDCPPSTGQCDTPNGQTEHYYSFHYILADTNNATAKPLTIPLIGSTDLFNPFRLTGWSGELGNSVLDPQYLKGYSLEFNIDFQGNLSSFATGAITFSDLVADSFNLDVTNSSSSDAKCVREPGIAFNGSSSVFRKKEFVGDKWCVFF